MIVCMYLFVRASIILYYDYEAFVHTANLRIIDVRYHHSTVFSTSLLLENRWNYDNRRRLFWDWQYVGRIVNMWYIGVVCICYICTCAYVIYAHVHMLVRRQLVLYMYVCTHTYVYIRVLYAWCVCYVYIRVHVRDVGFKWWHCVCMYTYMYTCVCVM